MTIRVMSTGNAGVFVQANGRAVYIDSFFRGVPGVGSGPFLRGADAVRADLILITHSHYDHLHPEETRDAALASGARVAGPADAIAHLEKYLPADRLTILEPPERKKPPAALTVTLADIAVTAFRTYHGRGHNSYLLDLGGLRVFHDADNERTQPYPMADLGRIDLLFLCPWAGSGAGDFVAALQPGRWFLIHMTEAEIQQHRADSFLPGLIRPVPPGVIALAPGETMEI
ncbi:MAG: MBL fold metallo-hydrolase [Planctomycetes bacterium]|nr:MBL fold metallo-hydrolase [Planctomycetota bacterium]